MATSSPCSLGLDFGSDSVRALVVDTRSGAELGAGVRTYPRWARGEFCDPARQRFRQHPLDHLEAMTAAVRAALRAAGPAARAQIAGIGVDTTGSTPVAVDTAGTPLGLTDRFRDDPDALFVLWKDHTAVAEAEEINALAAKGRWKGITRWVGGIYSSEWFWAKAAHVTRGNRRVAAAAASWVEHCDWLAAELSGTTALATLVRSRCAAGHKALWHPAWGGPPPAAFLARLHPRLAAVRATLPAATATGDDRVGGLTPAWARRLGLRPGIAVAAGAFDAHLGAVGAGVGPFTLVKVMGTSTCDMLTAPAGSVSGAVAGICGQVDGSIVPGLIGLEAGQSAFGDVYAWYRRLLSWPLADLGARGRAAADTLLPRLEAAALALPPAGDCLALDWFNGRRTPDADQRLRGAISGLHLGHDAPALYRALVESTAYGARAIVDRFVDQGVPVKRVVALGGIARKSALVMQVCADVLERAIAVVASDQCCALGAAIAGAVAGGLHPNVGAAQKAMASKVERTVRPQRAHATAYRAGYRRYCALGAALGG
jgi:L-ribulokinase